jgi:hypothetical protein
MILAPVSALPCSSYGLSPHPARTGLLHFDRASLMIVDSSEPVQSVIIFDAAQQRKS